MPSKYDRPIDLILEGSRLIERGYSQLLDALEMREDPEAEEAVEAAVVIIKQCALRMERVKLSLPKRLSDTAG
jgi:hypothetical protein